MTDDYGGNDSKYGSLQLAAQNGIRGNAIMKNAIKESSYRQFHGIASRTVLQSVLSKGGDTIPDSEGQETELQKYLMKAPDTHIT